VSEHDTDSGSPRCTRKPGGLLAKLFLAKGDGRYLKLLDGLTRVDVLILGDWGLDAPSAEQRQILLELLDDRYDERSTLFTSQSRRMCGTRTWMIRRWQMPFWIGCCY
jgi:IstB-like ATP binding protein